MRDAIVGSACVCLHLPHCDTSFATALFPRCLVISGNTIDLYQTSSPDRDPHTNMTPIHDCTGIVHAAVQGLYKLSILVLDDRGMATAALMVRRTHTVRAVASNF